MATACMAALLVGWLASADAAPETLAGTAPLRLEGDIASRLVDGVDRFLQRKLDESAAKRGRHWKRDLSSARAYNRSIEPNRKRLAHILGMRDPRVPFDAPELVATTDRPALVGHGKGYEVFTVRWPAVGDVHGEGLLLTPAGGKKPIADVVALPDADQTPEQLVGLVEGVAPERQFARLYAQAGCRVVVPTLVSRQRQPRNGRAVLSNREFLYRSAFELGRHLIGYEIQKVLACVDWFARDNRKIGVAGYGEGGMLALYAAALDPRIDGVLVSGYLGGRNAIWRQPIDRNVFGLLDEFDDAELLTMVFPRSFVIEAGGGPRVELPGQGGAPARLEPTDAAAAEQEGRRAEQLLAGKKFQPQPCAIVRRGNGPVFPRLLACLLPDLPPAPAAEAPPRRVGRLPDVEARQARQVHEIDRHNQWLLGESPSARAEFMKKLDTSSPEAYARSAEEYRRFFYDEVIGRFDDQPLSPRPRSRKAYDRPTWTGYEVVLDVFPDVIAYGVLLVPKDLKPGERRPVVVCQHGLEGRPQDVITGDNPAYHDFAAKLAEQGFITFAPQNLYLFTDRFRTLQRKANPLQKTLFSVIVPQHQQITDWLKSLPFVDGKRIAFYGLSYGGKTAMRVPPLVSNYCLSICSADFNEWVWKNASTRSSYSYVWAGEYEIFEFDLGGTFNYAEMAALIAPRPFMVERGHLDGVSSDEAVAYEFAKVRFLYEAKLSLKDRCRIEWFVGPHTIHGQGTFDFLHRWLDWPKR